MEAVQIVGVAGSTTFTVLSTAVPTFDAFLKYAYDKVDWLQQAPPEFTFQVNKNDNCSLTTNGDYKNMLMLCGFMNVKMVRVAYKDLSQESIHLNNGRSSNTQTNIPQFYAQQKIQTNTPANPTSNIPGSPPNPGLSQPLDLNIPPNPPNPPEQAFSYGNRIFRAVTSSNQNQSDPTIEPTQEGSSENGSNNSFSAETEQADVRVTNEKDTRDAPLGEFYPGATTRAPLYDVAPKQPDVVLKSANWIHYIKGDGQTFTGGAKEFRASLIKYSAKLGFKYKYIKNDNDYIPAHCTLREQDDCKWFVKAARSKVTDDMVIKNSNLVHTCTLSLMRNDNKRMGCNVIGELITNAVRAKPSTSAAELVTSFQLDYGFKMDYEKIWRGLEVARASVYGSYEESFNELKWYCDAINRTNPGSLTFLETEPTENRFKRMFLAFHASLEGFKSCRPILFVDGTFMKTRYKGTLLAATAKDGNNGLFPVVMAIVDGENTDNWVWFIKKLKDHLIHEKQIMFVSDRAGGLLNAFKDVYEKPFHFYCLYHLMKNIRGMYTGKKFSDTWKNHLCKLFKDAAYAPNVRLFDAAIEKFKHAGGDKARHFLQDLPLDKWALAFAPEVHRYGELTSNAAESFNSWILDARCLPVTFMLDTIRIQIMKWFGERKVEGGKWTGALTKEMEIKWNEDASIASSWIINPTNVSHVFEVLSNNSCVVDLVRHTCSCYQWQIRGFPCVHGIAVITRARWDIKRVVDPVFYSSVYKQVYARDINPVPSTGKYDFMDLNYPEKILPPVIRRAIGRPVHKRFRTRAPKVPRVKRFKCGRCGEYGTHHWTTCKDALEYDK